MELQITPILLDWPSIEKQLNTKPFFVNAIISGTSVKVFLNSGCLAYATVSSSWAKKVKLPCFSIPPRYLRVIDGTSKSPSIKKVAYFDVLIGNYY